jgi:hypothetical protein
VNYESIEAKVVTDGSISILDKRRRMSDKEPDVSPRQIWLRVAFAIAVTLTVVVAAYFFIRFITRVH